MPTTPLLNEKRRLSSRLEDNMMYGTPEPKRPRLDSKTVVQEIGPGNSIKSHRISENQGQRELIPSYIAPMYLPPLRRTASLNAELQLSLLYNDNSFTVPRVSNIGSAVRSANSGSQKKPDIASKLNHKYMKEVDKGEDQIPVVNLKKNGVKRKSESPAVERISALSTQNHTSSDVDSDCSESGRTSIPKSKIKQPAIVLTKMIQPIKKKATPPSLSASRPILPEASNVVFGGYVHRMASLNARACVSAYLEPERRFSPKHVKNGGNKKEPVPKVTVSKVAVSMTKCDSKSAFKSDSSVVPSMSKVPTEPPKSKPVVVNVNENGSVIPVSIKFDKSGSPYTMIINELDDGGGVPYNREGLLYNGDTIHPDAHVFVADDQKFQLPKRIVPTLVPARFSTVKRAVKKATSTGILPSSKKHSKVRNGTSAINKMICG